MRTETPISVQLELLFVFALGADSVCSGCALRRRFGARRRLCLRAGAEVAATDVVML